MQARAQPAGVQGSSSRAMRRATSMRPPSDSGAISRIGNSSRPSAASKKARRNRRLATWYWSPLAGERKKSSAKMTWWNRRVVIGFGRIGLPVADRPADLS
jgi:hypothetical protein